MSGQESLRDSSPQDELPAEGADADGNNEVEVSHFPQCAAAGHSRNDLQVRSGAVSCTRDSGREYPDEPPHIIPRSLSSSVLRLFASILHLHTRLSTLTTLAPCPETNEVFHDLVHFVVHGAPSSKPAVPMLAKRQDIDILIELPAVRRLVADVRRISAEAEGALESVGLIIQWSRA